MAADSSRDPLRPEGAPPSQRAAAEVGAMVAEQVRTALESAERSARDLRLRARDSASADREAVDRRVAAVLDEIDRVEAQVAEVLRLLRDEVRRIAEEERNAPPTVVAAPSQDPGPESPPEQPHAAPIAPPLPPARRRRRLWRRGEAGAARCAVCGRTAQAGDEALDRWVHTAGSSLCAHCRDDRWQLPPGGGIPYRPSDRT